MAIVILLCFYFGFHDMVTATTRLSVHTHNDFIHLSWNQTSHPPDQWTVTYNVMGTNYHSVLKIPGNQTSARIDTTNYPGVFYNIKLFASINGTETMTGIGFGISDCSNTINATLGSSYPFESFGYPGGLTFGAICTWNFIGSNITWFRIHLEDFDIGNTSCNSYLNVGATKICGNDTGNRTLIVQEQQLSLRLNYRERTSSRGIIFTVSAIHRLEMPTNVTASNIDDNIFVEWRQPNYHPDQYTYMLRVSHFPFTSHLDLEIDGNKTSYTFEITSHRGQNFSVQVQSVSDDIKSNFTDPVFTTTNCNKVVFLRATETFIFQTEQYPHHYLSGLTCHFRFQTEEDFRLLILTNDIDIGRGKMCDATFLLIHSIGKFCADNVPPSCLTVNTSTVEMTLATSSEFIGRGVNISITSVANPPSAPIDVRASSDAEFIHLMWKPSSQRQSYIKGYIIQYFIVPKTPGATVSVDKDVQNITLNTKDHPGRLFAIRIAGYSDGGVGDFSLPFYVRAGCGRMFHLARHETIKIMVPIYEGRYEAGVVCRWTVQTESPLWMKITVVKLMLEASANCTGDYVNVTGVGRLCGSRANLHDIVVKEPKIEIIFRTDYHNESEGFSFLVEAAGCAPGIPGSVNATRAGFSIMVNWTPPQLHRRFVTGYIIHYKFHDGAVSNASKVAPDTLFYALDMTSYPGRLVEIWLQATGDTESSIATNKTLIRSECGRRFYSSPPTYISSPYYQNNLYNNLKCVWSFEMTDITQLEMTFLRLNLNNKKNGCNNSIRVNDNSFCDDSIESKVMVINSSAPVVLEFSTGSSGKGAYFLLKVELVTKKMVESDTSNPVPSCFDNIYSSTPILMTSYLGTLLASSLLMYSHVEDHSPPKTSGKTKTYHNSFPTDSIPSNLIQLSTAAHILSSTASVDESDSHSNSIDRQKQSVNGPLSSSTFGVTRTLENKEQISTKRNHISPTMASSYFISYQSPTTMADRSRIKTVIREQTLFQEHTLTNKASVSEGKIDESYKPGKRISTLSLCSETAEIYLSEPEVKPSLLDIQTIVCDKKSTTTEINESSPEVKPSSPEINVGTSTLETKPSAPEEKPSSPEINARTSTLKIKPNAPEVKPSSPEINARTSTLKIKPNAPEVKPSSPEINARTSTLEIKPSAPKVKPSSLEINARTSTPEKNIKQSSPKIKSSSPEISSSRSTLEIKPNIPEINVSTLKIKPKTPEVNTNIPELKPSTREINASTLEIKPDTLDVKPNSHDIKSNTFKTKPTLTYLQNENTIATGNFINKSLHNPNVLETPHLFSRTESVATLKSVGGNIVRASRDAQMEIKECVINCKENDGDHIEVSSSKYLSGRLHYLLIILCLCFCFTFLLNI